MQTTDRMVHRQGRRASPWLQRKNSSGTTHDQYHWNQSATIRRVNHTGAAHVGPAFLAEVPSPAVRPVAVRVCTNSRTRPKLRTIRFQAKPFAEVQPTMQKFITLFLAIAVLLAVAAAPGVLNQPAAPAIQSTQNGGELEITWDAIPGAQFYTVGWINWTEGQPVHSSGGDWLSLFHYTTVAGDRASYTVKGQNGGDNHFAIIRATDVGGTSGRFGGGYSAWSSWSSQPAQPAGQPTQGDPPTTDCMADGTCIPVLSLGTYSGTGDNTAHVFDLSSGVHRMTLTGDALVSAELIATETGRNIFYFDYISSGDTSAEELVTVDPDDTGTYLLEIDADNQAKWTFTIERVGSTSTTAAVANCSSDTYDRDDWGTHPGVPAGATATWTLPADNVAASDLTMDHHVALKDAHISGGCSWSSAAKNAFSIDNDNLNPTTRSFNSSKAARTPDQLTGIALRIIDTAAEKCDYATQHKSVKDEHGLSMTTSESDTVTAWLELCN